MTRAQIHEFLQMRGPLFKTAMLLLFLLAIVLLQFAHIMEHGLQSAQVAWWHVAPGDAHGYSALLDHEYFHTIGGWIYWFAQIFFFVVFQFSPEFAAVRAQKAWNWMIGLQLFAIAEQFYHQQENVMQLGQSLYSNCDPCPGFLGMHSATLGYVFDPIYMHFWFNFTVYIPELIVFAFLIKFFGFSYFRIHAASDSAHADPATH